MIARHYSNRKILEEHNFLISICRSELTEAVYVTQPPYMQPILRRPRTQTSKTMSSGCMITPQFDVDTEIDSQDQDDQHELVLMRQSNTRNPLKYLNSGSSLLRMPRRNPASGS